MTSPVLGILHPGQMGAGVAAQALHSGATVLWCPSGRSPATAARAEAAGLSACDNLAHLCEQADIILSICPPAAAEQVATDVAAAGFAGLYVEANAINPSRYHRICQALDMATLVLDGAIIGPPPTDDRRTGFYLAGPASAVTRVADVFAGSTVRVSHLPQQPPAASALKMAFSGYQKSTRVLAAIAHALARRYDVTDALLAEAVYVTRSPLADPDFTTTVAARAWRWAPELHDIAESLADNDLPPDLASATAAILSRWAADKDGTLNTTEALDRLLISKASDKPSHN
jgi:3-hydroxyisobutyrate dehydrogenase-like beta-hydroxyacid dehydrogenase